MEDFILPSRYNVKLEDKALSRPMWVSGFSIPIRVSDYSAIPIPLFKPSRSSQ